MATPVMFQIGEEMLATLDAYCAKHKLPRAQVIREAIAKHIGLDDASLQTQRRTKYANPEERKKANRDKQKAERDAVKQLMALYRKGARIEDMQALAKTMNINLDDL